jgi:hypothetical protein
MEPSIDDLLVRQVSALVRVTADAVCTREENAPAMEAQFYRALAVHYAEKQRLAAVAAFAKGEATSAQKGLIYW